MSAISTAPRTAFSSIFQDSALIPDALTENGAWTFESTSDVNLDFFGNICRSGKTLTSDVIDKLDKMLGWMWSEDPELCLKNIFYKRDVREGAGEKAIFQHCYRWLFDNHPETAYKNLVHVPFYGYWKDLLGLLQGGDQQRTSRIVALFSRQLLADYAEMTFQNLEMLTLEEEEQKQARHQVSLAAKWAPSVGGAHDRELKICREFAKQLELGSMWQKKYRKMLSFMRAKLEVVERKMCAQLWEEIKLERVPSVAMNQYKKAFAKHMPEEFEAWKGRVKRGESKVNASVLMPHELISRGQLEDGLTQLQWESLRAHAKSKGALKGVIPICDFSGSMMGLPFDVSMAMGILISELAEEPFRDLMISFSESPTFFRFTGTTLAEKVGHAQRSAVSLGLNTDIIRCFTILLEKCVKDKVPREGMPKKILLLTDGQWDCQTSSNNCTCFQSIRTMYEKAGYEVPVLVFWNLRGNVTNVPVTKHETGAILISGWSVNLLKSIIESDDLPSPLEVMKKTLGGDRYARLIV